MNPGTYARLYGPPQPAPRRERTNVTALAAAVLWTATAASLAWLTFLVALAALWGAADGAAVGGFVQQYVLAVGGATALLTALAFAPGVRRLSWAGRLVITGALACPLASGLAIGSWIYVS
ncbi:hypothetical protein AB5J56_00520 [Streptomyces sp. R21]|uniref:Uncharacterized protein n=1 Tax=Streptomyces sp. R21 TaxID=3238627 RepID=A0AB39NYI5_9ACTN